MTRSRLAIPVLLGLALTVGGTEASAKKMPARPAAKPRPPPPPAVDPWDQAGPTDVPDGPDAALGSSEAQPLVEATATIWAQAGSRSWTGCSNVAREAGKQLWGYGEEANNYQDNHHWAIQAGECPNAPEVLTMAARSELLRRFDLPEGLDADTDLSLIESTMAESRDRAVAWIDDAQAELTRRRDVRSLGLEYWRGRAMLSTGDLVGARRALQRSLKLANVEGWKLRRLLALVVLYQGDLDSALELAHRGLIDAPASDKLASFFVLALVLDRAGDPAGSRRYMQMALDRDDGSQQRALETAMPLHERLYLRAFARTLRNDPSGAMRVWAAYLARSEPEAPERRLAERHLAEVRPLPSNLGGPAHPDEGADANSTPPASKSSKKVSKKASKKSAARSRATRQRARVVGSRPRAKLVVARRLQTPSKHRT